MSISSELLRIQQNIASAYQAVVTKGGTLPATQNATNLPEAIGTLGNVAPEGYTLREYIASNNNGQYIDTGIKGGASCAYEIKMRPLTKTVISTYQSFFGGSNTSTFPKIFQNNSITGDSSQYQWLLQSAATGTNVNLSLNFSKLNKDTVIKYDGLNCYQDGSLLGQLQNNGWGTRNVYVANRQEANKYATMYIYYLKMWTDGALVRDFVPVTRNSDGKNGLYDWVSKTFFPSKTSYDFARGGEVPGIVIPEPSTKSGSVKNQILRLNEQVANAYNVCSQLGRALPETKNSLNLANTILGTITPTTVIATLSTDLFYKSYSVYSYVEYDGRKYSSKNQVFEASIGESIKIHSVEQNTSDGGYAAAEFRINGSRVSNKRSELSTWNHAVYIEDTYTIPDNTTSIKISQTSGSVGNYDLHTVVVDFITQ